MTCCYEKCDAVATVRLTNVRMNDADTGEDMEVCDFHVGMTHAVALVDDEIDL